MIAGHKMHLGDTEYVIPPLTLGTIEEYQEKLSNYQGGTDKESVTLVLELGLRGLRRNYPELTMEVLKEQIDMGNMSNFFMALMGQSRLIPKENETGGAEALVKSE